MSNKLSLALNLDTIVDRRTDILIMDDNRRQIDSLTSFFLSSSSALIEERDIVFIVGSKRTEKERWPRPRLIVHTTNARNAPTTNSD